MAEATKSKRADRTNIVVRIDRALYDRFVEIAETQHRTGAAEIRRLVSERVEEVDGEARGA